MTTKMIRTVSTRTTITTYQSCDNCLARAKFKVIFSFGELDFCLHHFNEHEMALTSASESISEIGLSNEDKE